MDTTDTPPSNKRRKRSELKELLLETGLQLMADQSGPISAEALNYKLVFDRLEQTHGVRVTHASVHERIWPSQQAFQLDVLRAAAESLPADTFLQAGAAAGVLLTSDLSTTDGRRRATREMIRVACNSDMASPDITLSVYRSIRGTLSGLQPDDPEYPRIEKVIEETRVTLASRYLELFQQLAATLEVRAIDELGLGLDEALLHLFTQIVALADGFDMSAGNLLTLPTGVDRAPQEWHLYSWSVWAAVRSFFELDGDLADNERAL